MTRSGLFRNILCPIDFSEHSRHALCYAALLASRTNGRLTGIFVEDPFLAAASERMNLAGKTRAQLRRLVERTAAQYAVPLGQVSVRMAKGKPEQEILSAARRLRCDLIVMGAHGLTGVEKMMLGSTTARVFRLAPIPVLAIPPFSRRASTVLSRNWPEKWALAPVELGRRSHQDASAAERVATELGTHMLLLHVVPPHRRNRAGNVHDRLDRLRQTLGSASTSACRVLVGKAAGEIAGMAASGDVDLVILTRRAGPGVFGARPGTISYQVLCEAKTPVLALPTTSAWLRRGKSVAATGASSRLRETALPLPPSRRARITHALGNGLDTKEGES